MNYELLTNSTYLYLIENKPIKWNYSQLSRELGITRQTISKEYDEFKDLENWNTLFDIQDFHNEEPNKIKRAVLILEDLRPDIETTAEKAEALGVARSSVYVKTVESFGCVYKIVYNNEVIYIGSTKNFEQRKKSHLNAIRLKQTSSKLYKYCADNEIKETDVEIIPIINSDLIISGELVKVENAFIDLLKPIGNCESTK